MYTTKLYLQFNNTENKLKTMVANKFFFSFTPLLP